VTSLVRCGSPRLAVTPGGDLLVGDHFSGRVQRFHDGRYVSSFGMSGEGCGRLGAIGGVATDAQGNAYVLDTDQQLVQVFDANGDSVRCFGGRGPGLGKLHTTSGSYAGSSASGGIAVAGKHVYVADSSNNRVQRFTLAGKDPKILGKGKLQMPQGLAVQGARLLAADDGHHRIVELTTSGRYVTATSAESGVRLRFPYDVAFDAHGGAYVADNNLHRIVQLDRHLRRVRTWGSQGHGKGKFVYPRALAIQPNGHVLAADAGNDPRPGAHQDRWLRPHHRDQRARPAAHHRPDRCRGQRVRRGRGRRRQRSDLVVRPPRPPTWRLGAVPLLPAVHCGRDPAAGDRLRDRPHGRRRRRGRRARVRRRRGARDRLGRRRPRPVGEPRRRADRHRLGRPADRPLRADPRRVRHRPAGKAHLDRSQGKGGRTTFAIAELSDGTIAISEGTSRHQTAPADGAVAHLDAAGNLLATWSIPRPPGGQPSIPAGLAATQDGGVWVADATNDRLLRLAADGTITQTIGGPGTGPGELADPRGLELDCDGGLLVADYGNNRIQRYAGVDRAPRGCAPTSTPTAAGHPPAAVGLQAKTKDRAKHPAARLGAITATCRRSCTLATQRPMLGVVDGRKIQSFPLKVTITGSAIVLRAPAGALKAMSRHGVTATAGVVVTATAKDGVVDTAGITWQFN
jgi:DNA-binding beta-propeller fold protein YncE